MIGMPMCLNSIVCAENKTRSIVKSIPNGKISHYAAVKIYAKKIALYTQKIIYPKNSNT